MFGLMGGVYAISFADFFYNEDGSSGTWNVVTKAGLEAYILRRLNVAPILSEKSFLIRVSTKKLAVKSDSIVGILLLNISGRDASKNNGLMS
jgi:hypothetical protein